MEQKEQAEFTELLQKYSSMVLRIAFSNVKNLQDAQDIAQEVFISVLTKRPQFDSEEHEKAWLIRVTINRCKNHVKSFWNRHTEGLSEDLSYLPEEETGVTTMYMAEGMDTGDILLSDRYPIDADMTMGELHDALSHLGPITLKRTLEALANGTLTRTPQNHEEATYAPMVNRDTGKIDWSASAQQIHNLVRGTNPFPVSFSFDETGARIKIWRTLLTGEKRPLSLEPGTVTEASKEGILVAAGDAMLRITELQGPSAKKMTAGEYVNGHKITKFT